MTHFPSCKRLTYICIICNWWQIYIYSYISICKMSGSTDTDLWWHKRAERGWESFCVTVCIFQIGNLRPVNDTVLLNNRWSSGTRGAARQAPCFLHCIPWWVSFLSRRRCKAWGPFLVPREVFPWAESGCKLRRKSWLCTSFSSLYNLPLLFSDCWIIFKKKVTVFVFPIAECVCFN